MGSVIKGNYTAFYYTAFYGCETCLLTLKEERKLRLFENMVLGRIFGPRWDGNGGMKEIA